MLRRGKIFWRSYKSAAESFREYLKYSDAELPSLESLFPKGRVWDQECVEFHKELCKTMIEDGHKVIGVKVIPSGYEGIQCFRDSGTICTPLFSCHTGRGSFEISKYRVQYVEGALCLRLADGIQTLELPSLFRASSCSVALEIVGTRFPFYPPSISALACDLGGHIGFFKGPDSPTQKMGEDGIVNHHFVLSHNGEPVQVGCGKLCHGGSPFAALKEAAKYSQLLGIPLERDHIILCSGACPRFPAQRGSYNINWGIFGSTSCSLK